MLHIDRLDSLEHARATVDSTAFGFVVAGGFWRVALESSRSEHRWGRHVTWVGPLALPSATSYGIQIQAAAFGPGMYSVAHHHSGPEVVHVIAGEACYERPTQSAKIRPGETVVIPAGTPHRAVVPGSTVRHVFALIVYNASQPPTTPMDMGPGLQLLACAQESKDVGALPNTRVKLSAPS
jgi:quercetin dioxygenase-like cupin family protein